MIRTKAHADILNEIKTKLSVSVPTAGKALADLSRNSSYEAARRGDFPVIQVGGRKSVPTAYLRRKLGLGD